MIPGRIPLRRLAVTALLAAGALRAPRAWAQAPRVPFEPDVQVTWAASLQGESDYEFVVTVMRVDSAEALIKTSWNRGTERQWQHVERPLSSRERRFARSLYFYSSTEDPRQFRGTTQSLASVAILNELKRTGRANIVLLMPGVTNVPFRGTIERVGTGTEPFPALLDGKPVTLQGVRARGALAGDGRTVFTILMLDDPEAPWVLEASSERAEQTVRSGSRRLVRIATRRSGDERARELAARCITSVHDIYFASGSDALDSTSTPALDALARTLREHGDWRVTIVGHTDSVGTAASNLDLSKRRAERVRRTLAGSYGITSQRLASDGKGETSPIDDNGTLLGRARNRRVDLVRACPQGNPP